MTINPLIILYVLLGLGVIWTIIWLWIVRSNRFERAEPMAGRRVAKILWRLLFPMLAVLIIGLIVSFYWLPYPSIRAKTVGQPKMTISVAGVQWAWIMSTTTIPAHVPVEFDVTARDVNHDFAIYSPQGQLLTQVQAMPGYTNKLIYKFDQPGHYTVRCLEYCGLGHEIMFLPITVK